MHSTSRGQLLSCPWVYDRLHLLGASVPSPGWLCCVGMSPATLGHRRHPPGWQDSDLTGHTGKGHWESCWHHLSCLKISGAGASGCILVSRRAHGVQLSTQVLLDLPHQSEQEFLPTPGGASSRRSCGSWPHVPIRQLGREIALLSC